MKPWRGSSPGLEPASSGNYHSACRARSHTEFTARIGIVLDESDESELWLGVTDQRKWGNTSQRVWLVNESGQLRAIFAKAYVTARRRERGAR